MISRTLEVSETRRIELSVNADGMVDISVRELEDGSTSPIWQLTKYLPGLAPEYVGIAVNDLKAVHFRERVQYAKRNNRIH